jgi:hypothetical protein
MSYGSAGAGVWTTCSALPALTSAPGRPMFLTFSLDEEGVARAAGEGFEADGA